MRTVICLLVAAVTFAAAAPAFSQEYGEGQGVAGPVVFNLGGEFSIPVGPSADRFNVGWGFTAGLTYNPSKVWGVQAEYQFSWYDVMTGPLAVEGIDGNHYLHYWDLNLVVRPLQKDRFGLYLVAGPGVYYRRVTLTEVTGVAVVPYCDPFFYFCSTTAVPAEDVLASRDSWDFGVNGGIGATLGLGGPTRLYVEARYHYIFGPTFTDFAGKKRTADGQYLPLILGVQF